MHDDEDTTMGRGLFETNEAHGSSNDGVENRQIKKQQNKRQHKVVELWIGCEMFGRSYFTNGVIISCKRKGRDGCVDTYFLSSNGSSL